MSKAIRLAAALSWWTLVVAGPVRADTTASARVSIAPRPSPRSLAAPDSAAWDSLRALVRHFRWAAAESVAVPLVRGLERTSPPDSLAYSRALYYFADARLHRRLFSDGRGFDALDRVIGIRERHAPDGDDLLARAHALAALFYPEAGSPDRARLHAEAALHVLAGQSPMDSALAAQVRLSLAVALSTLGRLDEARPAFERALRFGEAFRGPDSYRLVPALAEYGAYLGRVGEFDAARTLLMRAARNAVRDPRPRSDLLQGTLSRLSTLENRAGNLAESVDLAERAYELARARVGEGGVTALRLRTILAYRLEEFGDHQAAAAHLSAIVPQLERKLGPTNPQTLNARLALVNALLETGRTGDSRRELARIRPALTRRQKYANDNAAYLGMLEADLDRALGNPLAARETLEAAIRVERAKHDPLGGTLATLYTHEMAVFRGPAGRAAAESLGRAADRLGSATRVRGTPEWTALVTARAGAEARVGLHDAAWTHALEAERRARERLRYALRALPDRRALQLARELGEPCELLAALARPGDGSELATAWDRIVRWRGLVGHEIARRRPPAAADASPGMLAAHARWVAAQRRLAQLVVSGAARPGDPETADRFEAARREAEEAEGDYVRLASSALAPDDSVSLDRVLARLSAGQALVAFAVAATGSDDRTLDAFVATGDDRHPRLLSLGPVSALRADASAWEARLASPPADPGQADADERACRRLGVRVRERMWDPIARELGGATVAFLVSAGPATGLPWMALPTGRDRYLAEGPIVIRQLDAERELLPRAATRAARGLLAVGGPDFDHAGPAPPPPASRPIAALLRSPGVPCSGERPHLDPLPGSLAEVEDIARRWPPADGRARVLTGAAADEATFKSEAPGHAVIHLATHGVVIEDTCGAAHVAGTRGVGGVGPVGRPRRGRPKPALAVPAPSRETSPWLGRQVWLALAGANLPPSAARGDNDGLLTAEEVVTLDLRGTDWVVLSACQSGGAPSWVRQGVLGMRRAFHLAGAHSVIASQWPVADESTREWMDALYDARARGEPAGAAVQHACRAVLAARRRDGRSTDPFYWAAFSASGE